MFKDCYSLRDKGMGGFVTKNIQTGNVAGRSRTCEPDASGE